MKKIDKTSIVGYWKRRGCVRAISEYEAIADQLGVSVGTVKRAIKELGTPVTDLNTLTLSPFDHAVLKRACALNTKAVVEASRRVIDMPCRERTTSCMTDYEREYLSKFDAAQKTELGYIKTDENYRVWF